MDVICKLILKVCKDSSGEDMARDGAVAACTAGVHLLLELLPGLHWLPCLVKFSMIAVECSYERALVPYEPLGSVFLC